MTNVKNLNRLARTMDRDQVRHETVDEDAAFQLLLCFSARFVAARHRESFELQARRWRRGGSGVLEFNEYLESSTIVEPTTAAEAPLTWLCGQAGSCYRFDQRAGTPALRLAFPSVPPAWASSWPGLFVDLDVRRALIISLDLDRLLCASRS